MRMSELADSRNGESELSNFGALRERVNNIDKRLGELVEGVDALNKTIHEAGKTKWGELIGFSSIVCLVLGAMWLLIVVPVKDDIKALQVGTMTAKEEAAREIYVDRELLRLESDLKEKASKEDVRGPIADIKARIEEFNNEDKARRAKR